MLYVWIMLRCRSFTRLRKCRCIISSQKIHTISTRHSLFYANKNLSELMNSGRIDEARKVFDTMPKRDEFSWNTVIAGYANVGRFHEARALFNENPKTSTISWASLISGYCKMGCENESFELFWRMQHEGYKPNKFVFGSLLRMCSINGLLPKGEQIHGFAIKTQYDRDVFIVTGLIDMYVKCLRVLEAEYLFERMTSGKNHVTWTAMINGYSLNGDDDRAIQCFRGMRTEGVEANQYTFPAVLTACGSACNLMFGLQVHSCIVHGGFGANVFVQSALVNMYAKCGDLRSARKALESREVDDVISWNTMIVGCVRQGFIEDALSLFQTMYTKRMEFDEFTYPSILNALASKKDVINGKSIHTLIFKTGFESYKLVNNALVDMYAKQNDLSSATKVFNSVEEKDVISWTSLVTGCAHNGCHEEALKLFCDMRIDGINPDQIVTASVLSSCAELALLDFGQQVHANFIKSEPGITSLSVNNSLITMYANCGCLEKADKIFASMQITNVITWTALIVGYAQNGKSTESFCFYDEMIACGTKPDFITFIGLLFSCSHAGLVERGRYYFDSMVKDYGIRPGPDHYACMIDLLSRSGKMNEAQRLLEQMDVKPDATVWKALLAACRVHKNVDLAKRAANALFELDPRDAVPYVMLSSIYSATGNWEEAAALRILMKSRGISKEPGRSWMEVNSKVHSFVSEDRSHPKADGIYLKVDEILKLIKEAGYVPDLSYSLRDVNDEGKEYDLAYHSEKLAVAFGLLYVPQGAPITIYKNLRVCGDCHTAMKFISDVFQRHIVLRDSNCFHHFKEGRCSCGDYW